MSIEVYCDGLCAPRSPGGTACYGFVVYRDGTKIGEGSGVMGKGEGMTNNVAEYGAAIKSLEWLLEHGFGREDVILKSDSQLLIRQLSGEYTVKSERIVPLYRGVSSLLRKFGEVKFQWVRREGNAEADALSQRAYAEFTKGLPPVIEGG